MIVFDGQSFTFTTLWTSIAQAFNLMLLDSEISTNIRTVKDQFDRQVRTAEVLNAVVLMDFNNIEDALNLNAARKSNLRFNAAEALFNLSARSDAAFFDGINDNIQKYAEPSGHFAAAYGARMFHDAHGALQRIIDLYNDDPNTRQMFLQIADQQVDLQVLTRDKACNQLVQFIRNSHYDVLDMTVTSRSSDFVWGFNYDVFNFTVLHAVVANLLKIPRGQFIYQIQSLHVYERHFEKLPQWGMCIAQQESPHFTPAISESELSVLLRNIHRRTVLEWPVNRGDSLFAGDSLIGQLYCYVWGGTEHGFENVRKSLRL